MKNCKKVLLAIFLLSLTFIIFSCSQFGTGSVAFQFDKEFIEQVNQYKQKSAGQSRSVLDSYINGTTYVEVSLEGDKELTQTVPLEEDVFIEFEGIPVGARIRAVLTLFSQEDIEDPTTREDICSGESAWTVITAGENILEITLKDLTYRIYVTYINDQNAQSGGILTNSLQNELLYEGIHDGKSKASGYVFIQSAIDWIAANGKSNIDYEIILTGYNEANAFNQQVAFGASDSYDDTLSGHAKSITVSSENKNIPAIHNTNSCVFSVQTSMVPIYFKNIMVESSANVSNRNGGIINAPVNKAMYVTMCEGTSFVGSGILAQYGGAVYLDGGTFTMQDDASISGFASRYEGGAVCINRGSFTMKDNALISDCSVTSSGGGGAVAVGAGTGTQVNARFTMEGNACIEDCVATAKGGAVLVTKYGTFTMKSGTIKDCTINGASYNYGHCIYVESQDTNAGDITLSGGSIIYTNTTTSHDAIFVNSGACNFEMSGNVYIQAPNVIKLGYANSNSLEPRQKLAYIQVTDKLTQPLTALIDIYAANESVMAQPVVEVSGVSNASEVYSHFMGYDAYYFDEGFARQVDYKLDATETVSVGDIVFANDNSRARASSAQKLTYMDRQKVVGLIFYKGTEAGIFGTTPMLVGTQIYSYSLENANSSTPEQFDYNYGSVSGTVITNFPQSGSYPDTSASLSFEDAVFSSPKTGATYLPQLSSIVTQLISYSSFVSSKYPLLEKVLKYGNSFTGTAYYPDQTGNSDDSWAANANNWYVPTIAEYKPLYTALQNADFKNALETFCGSLSGKTFMSVTQCSAALFTGNTTWHYYHYVANLTTGNISCLTANTSCSALPIHTYVAD